MTGNSSKMTLLPPTPPPLPTLNSSHPPNIAPFSRPGWVYFQQDVRLLPLHGQRLLLKRSLVPTWELHPQPSPRSISLAVETVTSEDWGREGSTRLGGAGWQHPRLEMSGDPFSCPAPGGWWGRPRALGSLQGSWAQHRKWAGLAFPA